MRPFMKALGLLAVLVFGSGLAGAAGEAPVSGATEECLSCHAIINPGIVESWKKSRHAATTPAEALAVQGLARRVSSETIPEELKKTAVGCAECHTLDPKSHADTFDHNGHNVHVVVSSKDCSTCHTTEAQEFDRNIMAHAHGNLMNNGVFQQLVQAINGIPRIENRTIQHQPPLPETNADSCLYCHGTQVSVSGTQSRETTMGEMTFPVLVNWPNGGVGRINPDGSRGSCAACHSRHEFSMEKARKPTTCKECHAGPDVPASKVYEASKHGKVYETSHGQWNFAALPWMVGRDFTAPTCSACHISLLVDAEGKMIVKRTHEMKDRLPWRIFGLIYAHPQPKEPDTTLLRNQDGLPLPADFKGNFAQSGLYNDQEREAAQNTMQASCLHCHAQSWVSGFWDRFHKVVEETNLSTRTATQMMEEIWAKGLATNHTAGGNPFDEFCERVWSDTWLLYANSTRFSNAMAGGGDYGVFAEGRYQLMRSVHQLEQCLPALKGPRK